MFVHRNRRRVQVGPGEKTDPRTGEVTPIPSRTKQEFRDECDINFLLRQYGAQGLQQRIALRAATGQYASLPEPQDFQESVNLVIAASDAFNTLPSRLRERFGNDPEHFLRFMSDPDNQEEAIKLGLATRKPEPQARPGEAGGTPPPPPAPPAASSASADEPPKK